MGKKKRDRVDGYSPPETKPSDPWADHFDSYKNELTGIGDFLRDKTKGGRGTPLEFVVPFLTSQECGDRWRGSDLGARVIETIPDEMTREGWEISVQPDEEDDTRGDAFGEPDMTLPAPKKTPQPIKIDDTGTKIAEDLHGDLDRLDATAAIKTALDYERAYGGSAILIGADDGMEDLSQPLNEDLVTEVRHLTAFRGGWDGELIAADYYNNPSEPRYGQPSTYWLRTIGMPGAVAANPGSMRVHESRLLVFPGQSVSREERTRMRGWGDSVFVRIEDVLSQYGQTWGGIAVLMQEFSQGILSIDGLAQALGGNNKSGTATLTKRALALNMGRSLSRILLVDAKEKFSRDTVTLSGLAEMLQQFALRLAAAADMPVALLFGQAPAGLNATGASDIRFFYDRIASRQRNRLLPQLKKLIRILFLAKSGPTKGVEPGRWDIRFRSLYQMTELEKAQLRKTVAETDHIYIQDGVLTEEEVAASSFGGAEWSMERVIDLEGRKKLAEQDEKDRAARERAMEEAEAKSEPEETEEEEGEDDAPTPPR